jgi:Na+/proline symporter
MGFGLGYLILRDGNGLYRDSGSDARTGVGLLVLICIGAMLYQLHAAGGPHTSRGDMDFPGLAEHLFAWIFGLAGVGLLFAFMLSLRSPRT